MSTLSQLVQEIESIEALVGIRPRYMVVLATPNTHDHQLLTSEFRAGNYDVRFHPVAGCDMIYYTYAYGSGAVLNDAVIRRLQHHNFIFSKIYTHCSE